jgi:hypothetical protein
VLPDAESAGKSPTILGGLLIPTLILLFGLDLKLAGSLSLAISLPTMLTGFARYSRDRSFVVLKKNPPCAGRRSGRSRQQPAGAPRTRASVRLADQLIA